MNARSIVPALTLGVILAAFGMRPAQAEFFNDVKRTFQTDVPHFFQDDIPCAFGAQPTSGAKSTCKSGNGRPANPAKAPLRGDSAPSPVVPPASAQAPARSKPIPY